MCWWISSLTSVWWLSRFWLFRTASPWRFGPWSEKNPHINLQSRTMKKDSVSPSNQHGQCYLIKCPFSVSLKMNPSSIVIMACYSFQGNWFNIFAHFTSFKSYIVCKGSPPGFLLAVLRVCINMLRLVFIHVQSFCEISEEKKTNKTLCIMDLVTLLRCCALPKPIWTVVWEKNTHTQKKQTFWKMSALRCRRETFAKEPRNNNAC